MAKLICCGALLVVLAVASGILVVREALAAAIVLALLVAGVALLRPTRTGARA